MDLEKIVHQIYLETMNDCFVTRKEYILHIVKVYEKLKKEGDE